MGPGPPTAILGDPRGAETAFLPDAPKGPMLLDRLSPAGPHPTLDLAAIDLTLRPGPDQRGSSGATPGPSAFAGSEG
jgi:hypothetical protein